MADVKAKKTDKGYTLSYKGQTTELVRRPDLYFDLTLGDQPPVKGFLKDHKQRFLEWVNRLPGEAPPAAQEGSSEPAPATAAPVRSEPSEPRSRTRAEVLREVPPDAEPNVTMSYPGSLCQDMILRSHGCRRQGDVITLVFEDYGGKAVRVKMGVDAARRHLERVESMLNAIVGTEE